MISTTTGATATNSFVSYTQCGLSDSSANFTGVGVNMYTCGTTYYPVGFTSNPPPYVLNTSTKTLVVTPSTKYYLLANVNYGLGITMSLQVNQNSVICTRIT